MARIKIRVHSGVFEVSLIRVIEERGSVEVLWDGGQPREFKWSSVVLGKSKEGEVVGQKPDVMAEPPPPMSGAAEAQRVNRAKKKAQTSANGLSADTAADRKYSCDADNPVMEQVLTKFSVEPGGAFMQVNVDPSSWSSFAAIAPAPTLSNPQQPLPMYYQTAYGSATSGQYPYGGGLTYQQYAYHPQYQFQAPYAGTVAGPSQPHQYVAFQLYGSLAPPPQSQAQAGPSGTQAASYLPVTQQLVSSEGNPDPDARTPVAAQTIVSSPASGESSNTPKSDDTSAVVSQDVIDALRKVTEQNFESLDATRLKELLASSPEIGKAIRILIEHSEKEKSRGTESVPFLTR